MLIDPLKSGLVFLPMHFTRNALIHTIAAADPELSSRAGLKYFLDIEVPPYPNASIFETLSTSEGREVPVDSSAVAVYEGATFRYNNINGKIDGLLTYQAPTKGQNQVSVIVTQTTPFRLRERVQGGTPAVDTDVEGTTKYAIKAGLDHKDFEAWGEQFWNLYQAEARQFLTWLPTDRWISPTQEEYLSFVLNFTPIPQEVRLRTRVVYQDGTEPTVSTKMSVSRTPLLSVLQCPVGPVTLSIPVNAKYYEVWLTDENNLRLSEVRRYWIDTMPTLADRYVMYVNSLGGWDTLRLIGQGSERLTVRQTLAERDLNTSTVPELIVINSEGDRSLTVSTGYFKQDSAVYLRCLQDLALSPVRYLLTDKGFESLRLTSNQLEYLNDDRKLEARVLTFDLGETTSNFSRMAPSPPQPTRPTRWRGLNLRYILNAFGKRTGEVGFAQLEKVYADNEELYKPITRKPNTPGDPDYLAPIVSSAVLAGSTPFPSVAISRLGTYNRSNCASGFVGGPATIVIPAGKYGGERPGDADALAEAEYVTLNTQAYANANGSCINNSVPFVFRIQNNTSSVGGADTPVVAIAGESADIVANTSAGGTQTSSTTYMPGTYNILCRVAYSTTPMQACTLQVVGKGRTATVTGNGLFLFENVVINSPDSPLTIKVENA